MREQQKDSVQSRFTAYVVVALANRRKRYLEKKYRTLEWEVVHEELSDKGYVNFDVQYHAYVSDRKVFITENWTNLDTLTELLQTPQLITLIRGLKEKERKEEMFRMYRPLLVKHSMDNNVFDEDLFQEFSAILLQCIEKFSIRIKNWDDYPDGDTRERICRFNQF